MGLLKWALAATGAALAFRSLARLDKTVRQIYVPSKSLLAKDGKDGKEYKDAYKAELPKEFILAKDTQVLQYLASLLA